MKTRIFSAVLSAFMLASASVGVTAYAEETAASSAAETVSAATETSSAAGNETDKSSETTVTSETILDFYGDSYYDTDGNASLIKSEQIIYNTEEMQFIAVTTKDGHVFYILINYTAENGQENVFFLNKVDDYDLYALLYAGDENQESSITPEQAAQAAENANGRVTNHNSTVTETAETLTDSEDHSEIFEQPKKNNMNNIYLLFGAIVLIGIGAAGFMLSKKKSKSKAVPEFEQEGNESDDDEEYDFYDENNSDDE